MNIGWIGLGNMGIPMVRNAAAKGYDMIAWNRTPRPVDVGNAKTSTNLLDAVSDKEVICLMVSDGGAVEDVLFGTGQVARQARQGTVIVNFSTIGVDETKSLAHRVEAEGLEWMEAPVSGSVGPAENATLVVLSGGKQDVYDRLRPFFLTMAKEAFYLGQAGSGAAMKLLVNAYLGAVVETASECMALADKAGLGRATWLDVIKTTAVWSPILGGKAQSWQQDDYPAAFALKHMTKDLGLTGDLSRSLRASIPSLASVFQVYLAAMACDLGELDMAGVMKKTEDLAGVLGRERS